MTFCVLIQAKQGSNTCNVDLDRFSFTPQSKTVVPPSSSSSTPSLMGTARTPATPQSAAKGWEMLDMYQQTRCHQGVMMEEAEDQVRCEGELQMKNLELFMVRHKVF